MRQLSTLPPERVAEVDDFVLFLKLVRHPTSIIAMLVRRTRSARLHYAEALLAARTEDDD